MNAHILTILQPLHTLASPQDSDSLGLPATKEQACCCYEKRYVAVGVFGI